MRKAGLLFVAPAVEGFDLFKVAGRSTSGWISSLKRASPSGSRSVADSKNASGSGLNLQNVDGRSQIQGTFPCQVHANAHGWRQMLMFEVQTCSHGRAFTLRHEVASITVKTARAGLHPLFHQRFSTGMNKELPGQ